MTTEINLLSLAHAVAGHAGRRQTVVAANIANADTPGYKARDVKPFHLGQNDGAAAFQPLATRPGHFAAAGRDSPFQTFLTEDEAKPNGNTVSLEGEMTKAVELRHQYDMALSIYRKSMDILRASLGR